jgi:dihydrofolate synthase/folylpolyglutamate synthase
LAVTSNPIPEPRGPASQARFESLPEWLAWQERLHSPAIELGLDRCRAVAARMGLLNPGFAVISVSGTNGKGSAVTMLDSILRSAGHAVGRYTSPHLVRYNERICVDGREVGDDRLCESFRRIDEARADITLTYFEFGTLAALDIFRSVGVDAAVMEVGLGGRLDAVNILDADAALVTAIDLDHEHWLGYDRESIGREKAGIFRNGKPAICADPEPPASIGTVAAETGARLYQAGRDFGHSSEGDTWTWRSGSVTLEGLPPPSLNHVSQIQNASGVLMTLHALSGRFPVATRDIRAGLAGFHLAGRFQFVPNEVPYILDVAHNPQAARILAANLARLRCTGRTHGVIGMLRDKNHAGILEALAQHVDRWYFASLGGERGDSAAHLSRVLSEVGHRGSVALFDSVVPALEAATAAAEPGDRIVVAGSFVTVGAAMRRLGLHS